jgi:fructose-bisphosphate aldolase class II
LVLHGSSGVADEDLRKAVSAGITKVNIGTLLNIRFTAAVRAHMDDNDTVTDPRCYLAPARAAVTDAVAAMLTAVD